VGFLYARWWHTFSGRVSRRISNSITELRLRKQEVGWCTESATEYMTSSPLILQDVLDQYIKEEDQDVSLAFFELANAPEIGYRLPDSDSIICIRQDVSACGKHTGGIVWETSYLLLNYLVEAKQTLGKILEVGAGCGLLGLVLAALGDNVVMTETREVLVNLQSNLERNRSLLARANAVRSCYLDWTKYEEDAVANHLESHSFDTILGTDVIFSPALVEPLLYTLQYMSHSKTTIYLCVQVRCATSHQMFLDKAASYNFAIQEITDHLDDMPSVKWSQDLECHLFRLQREDR